MNTRIAGIASATSISGCMAASPQALVVRPAAEQILAACRRYIAAEIHRRNAPTTGRLIARIRAAEVATHLDGLLAVHVFRRGRKRGVHTGTEAAMIKAAARAIADNWDEPHPDPVNAPHRGLRSLTKTVYEVLLRRHAEDAAANTPAIPWQPRPHRCSQPERSQPPEHPREDTMTTATAETTTTNGRTYPAFTSYGTQYDTLAAVIARLATLAVEDTLNGPSDDRTTKRTTLVEHLLRFANTHGSTRPAATIRKALTTAQYVYGHPGAPVLPVLEEIEIAATHTQ